MKSPIADSPLARELADYATKAPALRRPMLIAAARDVVALARMQFNYRAAIRATADLRAELAAAKDELAAERMRRDHGT